MARKLWDISQALRLDTVDAAGLLLEGVPAHAVTVVDADTLQPIDEFVAAHRRPGRVRLAIAARFGDVRLIDNADLFANCTDDTITGACRRPRSGRSATPLR